MKYLKMTKSTMMRKNNPFASVSYINLFKDEKTDIPANFLGTLYNLGLGFQDTDELDVIEIIMELEEIFDAIESGTGCLE